MAGLLFAASVGYPVLAELFLAKEVAVLAVCGAGAAAYGAGGDLYLTKPFGLEELVDHLTPVVRREWIDAAEARLLALLGADAARAARPAPMRSVAAGR